MGCGNTKTKDNDEPENKKEEINKDQNEIKKAKVTKIENFDIKKKKEKKIKINKKIIKDSKINGEPTKTSLILKENEKFEKKRNYEPYEEENNLYEKESINNDKIDEKTKKEKEFKERKEYLSYIKSNNIFKNDNIDKNNTVLFVDTTKKVRTIFIPSQKGFPKVTKYLDPIQGIKGPFWEINIEASKYEIMCPLWIEKNKEIIFYVNGKWKINNELECDCQGLEVIKNKYEQYMPNVVNNKFNKGALIGRVIYGEQFQIYDGLIYKSNYDGPLILKMNLNSVWVKDNPTGFLNVKIKGAICVESISDMDERIGWWKQLKIIEFNNLKDIPEYKIPSLEKMIIILFNKIRFDSKLFALQYLDNMKNLTPNSIKIYNELINSDKRFVPLKINISIIKLLKNFYEPFISGNNENSENESIMILKSSKIIKKYLSKCFNEEKNINHVSIIKYNDKNPFHLTCRLLFENEVRENILKSTSEEISTITLQTKEGFKKDIFYTILVLSNEKGNNNINYDISKNVKNFINEEQKINNDHNIINMVKINLEPLSSNVFNSELKNNLYDFN